jgi:hypothetical protein
MWVALRAEVLPLSAFTLPTSIIDLRTKTKPRFSDDWYRQLKCLISFSSGAKGSELTETDFRITESISQLLLGCKGNLHSVLNFE